MKDILIGIDAGTSVIKSVAFTLDGKQLAGCATANVYKLLDGGGVEQDPDITWQKTVETLLGLSKKIPDLAKRTAAIAVTGQGDGTWLIDKHGNPVGDAWLWLDARAGNIVDRFSKSEAESKRFQLTGTGLAACQQASQLMWIKQHDPELITKSATAFHCKDWLYFKLTGNRVTDPSEGCFTFGDYRTREYSPEILTLLDLEECRHLLPPILNGVEQNDPLSDSAALLTGLLQGTPVVLAYIDVVCTGLGAGVYDEQASTGCTIVGSTGIHMRVVHGADSISLNDDHTGFTIVMPTPDTYVQIQSNMSSTLNIDWLLDVAIDLFDSQGIKRTRAELLPSIDSWINDSRRGEILFQPYISEAGERGPFINAHARAGFAGLNSQHRFPDMMNSVIEGLALAARDCYESMGDMPGEIRLTGGAARSRALRALFANTLGVSLRTSSREEAGAAGAAMMAAMNIGHYGDMESCTNQWVKPYLSNLEHHDAAEKRRMDTVFKTFKNTRVALQDTWQQMADHKTS